ncbi:hypothetical protein YYE_05005 [Plasmodium vinckei vinckei]|uniref:Fam-c protein n=1 Tax=Plasmodium vinckei vinckei TaxID=54757 RepID=A0A081I8Y8_PLAVN|nr:hypothetical protein YYE_05005 [Plasmodium vinckei vinckei]
MNKRYIKIGLTLLRLVGFMENVAFAGKTDAYGAKDINDVHQKNDEYQKCKDKECKDIYETFAAIDHTKETLELLLKLADNTDGYSVNSTKNKNKIIYSKKIGKILYWAIL